MGRAERHVRRNVHADCSMDMFQLYDRGNNSRLRLPTHDMDPVAWSVAALDIPDGSPSRRVDGHVAHSVHHRRAPLEHDRE